MADAHANFAVSTVATAPSPGTSGTGLVVAAGDGALFPVAPFNATVWPVAVQPTVANAEIVRVTGVSTDTLTIVRGQEGSSARSIGVGDQIAATVTAKTLTDAEALPARSTVSFSTGSIAAGASESDDVAVFKAAQAYSLSTNRPARVRAYGTSVHRTADASRAIGVDPTGNHGLLLEVVTTASILSLDLAPPVNLVNLDGTPATTIYFAVTNLDTGTGVVTTTLTVRQAE